MSRVKYAILAVPAAAFVGSRRHAGRGYVRCQRAGCHDIVGGRCRTVRHMAWPVQRRLFGHLYAELAAEQHRAERHDPALEPSWRDAPDSRHSSGRLHTFRHCGLDGDYLLGFGVG